MIKAYLDGSYSTDGSVVAVAGVVAQEEQWHEFPRLWKEFLSEYGLARFHSTEYWGRHGQFRALSDAQLLKIKGDILAIFKRHKPFAVGAVVNVAAFREWRVESSRFVPEDPHYHALSYCLEFLIKRLNSYPVDDGVEICFDEDKQREHTIREMAQWHTDRLRTIPGRPPGHPEPQRVVKFDFGSSYQITQLQAADVIAHSAQLWGLDDLKTGNARKPFFLAGIEPECPIAIYPLMTRDLIKVYYDNFGVG